MNKLAWLGALAVWGACGGGGGGDDEGSADARPEVADAAVDGAPPAGSVRVTTYSRRGTAPPRTLAAGVAIYLIRPDGTVATIVTTGADGEATLDGVISGSAVTALYPAGEFHPNYVTTVLGVEPGDALVLGDAFAAQDPTSGGGAFTVTYPPIDAAYLELILPCATGAQLGASPASVNLDDDCQAANATVPILAYDDNRHVIGSAVLRDIDLAIGESFTIPAWSPPVEQVVRTAVAAEVESVELGITWLYPTSRPGDYREVSPAGAVATASFSSPSDADLVAASATHHRDSFGRQDHAQLFPASASSIDLPLGDVPWLGDQLTSIAEQRIHWIQDGDRGDAVVATVRYRHRDEVTGIDEIYEWRVIAPPGANELTWTSFPSTLPAPRGDDDLYYTELHVVDLATAQSYAELRAAPEWHISCPLCAVWDGELSAGAWAEAGGAN
jgi:hypothetical protein